MGPASRNDVKLGSQGAWARMGMGWRSGLNPLSSGPDSRTPGPAVIRDPNIMHPTSEPNSHNNPQRGTQPPFAMSSLPFGPSDCWGQPCACSARHLPRTAPSSRHEKSLRRPERRPWPAWPSMTRSPIPGRPPRFQSSCNESEWPQPTAHRSIHIADSTVSASAVRRRHGRNREKGRRSAANSLTRCGKVPDPCPWSHGGA